MMRLTVKNVFIVALVILCITQYAMTRMSVSCYGVDESDPSVCSGKGKCTDADTCDCMSGYMGDKCDVPVCYGYNATDSDACYGNGICDDFNTCICSKGYTGVECHLPICADVKSKDANCNCTDDSCEKYQCYPADGNDLCSGNGLCIAKDTCTCENLYSGDNCQDAPCYDYSATDSMVCNGNGNCTQGMCICEDGYSGDNCSVVPIPSPSPVYSSPMESSPMASSPMASESVAESSMQMSSATAESSETISQSSDMPTMSSEAVLSSPAQASSGNVASSMPTTSSPHPVVSSPHAVASSPHAVASSPHVIASPSKETVKCGVPASYHVTDASTSTSSCGITQSNTCNNCGKLTVDTLLTVAENSITLALDAYEEDPTALCAPQVAAVETYTITGLCDSGTANFYTGKYNGKEVCVYVGLSSNGKNINYAFNPSTGACPTTPTTLTCSTTCNKLVIGSVSTDQVNSSVTIVSSPIMYLVISLIALLVIMV